MKATKLPSGKYRARVYTHTVNGKKKYKSFTADTKKEAELLAYNFENHKKGYIKAGDITVGEAIDNYIMQNEKILSPNSVVLYKGYRKFSFQELMNVPISKLDNLMLRNAIAHEFQRKTRKGTTLSAKTLKDEFGFMKTAISVYDKNVDFDVNLPRVEKTIVKLPEPEEVFNAVKGTEIELPVLLAMWLSFSFSEIKGLKRSSIDGNYIQIDQVQIRVQNKMVEKTLAKVDTRTRKNRMPDYIKGLIDALPAEQEYLVELSHASVRSRLKTALKHANVKQISFHKLRHINASTMAMLSIPTNYAQERGGWSTDSTMKQVYTHTFTAERIAVDDKIDSYFNDIVGGVKKYPSYTEFLTFFSANDNKKMASLYNQIIESMTQI